MECYTYLRNVTALLSDGKTPYERRFGNHLEDLLFHLVHLVEYHPTTAKDQSRIHQFGKKVLPGLCLGYALYAGRISKGHVLVADIVETMDASEIYSKRLNAKGSNISPRKWKICFSSRRWTNQTSRRRSATENTHPHMGKPNLRRRSRRFSWRIRRVSSTTSRLVSGCR